MVRQRSAKPSFPSSNLGVTSIKSYRYRCVWRKARRINRFRAFSGPDSFFQTIDTNRCFRAFAPIRTERFPFSGRCVQPAPFLSGVFLSGSGIFSKKSQRFGRRSVGPDGLRKRRPFSFKKGTGLSACICRPEHDRSGLIFYGSMSIVGVETKRK